MHAARARLPAPVLWAGLVAGTIDVGAASLIYMIDPLIILRAIASGVLGPAAFHGGLTASLPGLVLQWAMAWLSAAIFVVAFVVMEYAVVRWSAAKPPHFTAVSLPEHVLAMLLFGLIVPFFAHRMKDGVR